MPCSQVPREEYVPAAYRETRLRRHQRAARRTASACCRPKLEGRILQALEIQPHEHALEVGTGSGFFAACIGRLARSVRTIDLFPDFVAAATANVRAHCGMHNVTAETADAMQLAEREAYDVIALTGSLPVYDAALRACPEGRRPAVRRASATGRCSRRVRVTRTGPSRLVAREPVRDGDARPAARAGAAQVRFLILRAPGG